MSEWIEVPRHRVLKIAKEELLADFDFLNSDGSPTHESEVVYRIVRKRDGKVFCVPRFHAPQEDFGRICFLEEV